jgi:PEP-CTERM motif-containing protein
MNLGRGKFLLLATLFLFVVSVAGWAQLPCGVANQITCNPWDGGSNLFASQNDTNMGGFGNFATTYQQFTLPTTWSDWSLESFHWVGGYFNPPAQGPITAWTLTFYADAAGIPGAPIASGSFPGNGGETFIGNVNGFPIYVYWLYFQDFDLQSGVPYWASVVPDLGFPPQWGWATGAPDGPGYQCFFGTCGLTGTSLSFAIDGRPTPEPGTLIMLGTGILGLAGTLRRKLM